MPNKNTFQIKPIGALINRYWDGNPLTKWIDPFAGSSPFNSRCVATNDLNGDCKTTHHLEALEFLSLFEPESFDLGLFDPPYSVRQISECYKAVGRKVFIQDTQSKFYGDRKCALARVIKPEGRVISCGWNSQGMGKTLGFEIEEILLVAHGGPHNDTIVTVEIKHDRQAETIGQEVMKI